MLGTLHVAVDRKGIAHEVSFHQIDLSELPECHVHNVTFDQDDVNDLTHSHVDWKEYVRHFLGMHEAVDQLHIFEKWFRKVWNTAAENTIPNGKPRKKTAAKKKKRRVPAH